MNYSHESQDHSFPIVVCVPVFSLSAIKKKWKLKEGGV